MVAKQFKAACALCLALVAAGCGRPITVQALVEHSGDPIEAVRIYKYRFTIFSLFPSGKSVQTDKLGEAQVTVGPSNTNLTMLCQGFEPVLMAVFEDRTASMSTDKGGYDYVLDYKALKDREIVPVEFRPIRRLPMELTITNSVSGAPVDGADIHAATFLYLPRLGVEPEWGLPAAQVETTNNAGHATVDQVTGFRNRITVRKPGFEEGVIEFDGRTVTGPAERAMTLRPLAFKTIDFQVIDAVTRLPVNNAIVHFGETRDGLPPGPEVWVKITDAEGRTGPMPVPDLMPCVITVSAKGYADWRGAPLWRTLQENRVKVLELKKP